MRWWALRRQIEIQLAYRKLRLVSGPTVHNNTLISCTVKARHVRHQQNLKKSRMHIDFRWFQFACEIELHYGATARKCLGQQVQPNVVRLRGV